MKRYKRALSLMLAFASIFTLLASAQKTHKEVRAIPPYQCFEQLQNFTDERGRCALITVSAVYFDTKEVHITKNEVFLFIGNEVSICAVDYATNEFIGCKNTHKYEVEDGSLMHIEEYGDLRVDSTMSPQGSDAICIIQMHNGIKLLIPSVFIDWSKPITKGKDSLGEEIYVAYLKE